MDMEHGRVLDLELIATLSSMLEGMIEYGDHDVARDISPVMWTSTVRSLAAALNVRDLYEDCQPRPRLNGWESAEQIAEAMTTAWEDAIEHARPLLKQAQLFKNLSWER